MRIIKGIVFDSSEINLFRSILPAFEFHPHYLEGIQGVLASFYNGTQLLSDEIHKLYTTIGKISYEISKSVDTINIKKEELDSIPADGDISIQLQEVKKFVQMGSKIKLDVKNIIKTCDILRDILSIAISHASTNSQKNQYKQDHKELGKKNITIHTFAMSKLDLVRYSCGCVGFRPYANSFSNHKQYASMISACATHIREFRNTSGRDIVCLDEICVENFSYVPLSNTDSDVNFNAIKRSIQYADKHKKAMMSLKEVLAGV